MSSTETIRPGHGFYALGCTCFGIGSVHYQLEARGLETALELLMIAGVSTIVLYTGYELPERSISTGGRWKALLLTVLVALAFAALAFLVWLTWSIDGLHRELSFLLTFAASLGAAVGARGSLYAVESNERLTETRELTKLLKINQRVLRHNLRNELSVVLGHLENIEDATDGGHVDDDLRMIRDHLEALLETTDRTRKIVSIWDTADETEHDLASVVDDQIRRLRREYPTATFSSTLPADCRVIAHSALPLAIREALTNAVEHNAADVSVDVSAELQPDETVKLEISDTGTGIPASDREAIGLPEETPLAHTQGLGLWILYWTIQASDGTIEFGEIDPEGTVVRIVLPAPSRSSTPRSTPRSEE
ncbi:sensor histidine kinase [Halorubrum salsamenti]|jgi:signal transduction histidine kinase|uniref:sensor histidine kinase n=1 Tax=Halorubrum salsamenti TaxID=2583990 RepID=UPI0011AA1C0E|nr:ATP-binding protein [Halorubrum salsamenti]